MIKIGKYTGHCCFEAGISGVTTGSVEPDLQGSAALDAAHALSQPVLTGATEPSRIPEPPPRAAEGRTAFCGPDDGRGHVSGVRVWVWCLCWG